MSRNATASPEEQPRSLWSMIFTGDRVLWIITALLAVVSVLVVYSSTAKMAYAGAAENRTSSFLMQQLLIIALGLVLIVVTHKINYQWYGRFAWIAYWLSVLLTVAVYFIGDTTNGAARWLPVFSFQFQPSECLKVATVLLLAKQLASRQKSIERLSLFPSLRLWTWRRDRRRVRRILRETTRPVLGPVVLACMVIFPAHTSSAVLLFGSCWVMMLIGRVRMRELMRLLCAVAVAGALALTVLNVGRADTAQGRVSTWIATWTEDRSQIPVGELSDTERAMIAIYNGGLIGQGAGQSTMRVELIHPESDYAFAFFVEEYGLILATGLLMLYLWIFYRARVIFERCGTAFPSLLVLGLALLIICQAMIHLLVVVNLLPETGQTLPMISRGGSSVLLTAIALGMIQGVSRQTREQSLDRPRSESLYENPQARTL